MKQLLTDHFRCPADGFEISVASGLSSDSGYFRVNGSATGYGRGAGPVSSNPHAALADLGSKIRAARGVCELPFDLSEVIANLRLERYPAAPSVGAATQEGGSLVRRLYYLARPLLPISVRRHLQRMALKGWDQIAFPRWPVDASVDVILGEVLRAAMGREGRVPFIWFWPEGRPASIMITHDVEQAAGRDFCAELMDLDASRGFKSSFNIVPEERYEVSDRYLDSIRSRGFEIGVHGLNHDGNLFKTRDIFESRAPRINEYGRRWAARGFRSPVLYRNLDWFSGFSFEYDMTIPNVAHLDPQRGGCATVMPYFIGEILELPLTTIQDYPLFNILGDYSIDRWREQTSLILQHNGLMSFNIHPDYVIPKRARGVYADLLDHLAELRDSHGAWAALPGEINDWWRQRAAMNLVRDGAEWKIEGEGSDKARIAYASLDGDRLKLEVESALHEHAA